MYAHLILLFNDTNLTKAMIKEGSRDKKGLFMELYKDNGAVKVPVINDYINDILRPTLPL